MDRIMIYDSRLGRYQTMDRKEFLQTVNCVNRLRRSKHHKVIKHDELMRMFDFPPMNNSSYFQVCRQSDLYVIVTTDEENTPIYNLNYDFNLYFSKGS